MKTAGLIVEYNPFHNGHLYHIEQTRKVTGADRLVCVMSGNFIQRGEPAITNKWARAEMALSAGIDLVIELPYPFAMSSAEYFAFGAVKLLDSLGIVDAVCFGSESGSIESLGSAARILLDEPEGYRALLKRQLSKGVSYPSAREAALDTYMKENTTTSADSVLNSPNNILGVEYLKALKKTESSIRAFTIVRNSNTYNDEALSGSISSATSIRKAILSGGPIPEEAIPASACNILSREFSSGRGPVSPGAYENLLLAAIRTKSSAELSRLPFVAEGLQNRIKEAACVSGSWEELMEKAATRRYTRTRLQRILFNSLIGLTAEELDKFMAFGGPQYIRVLGFNRKGTNMLSEINKKAVLPVMVKPADFKQSCNPLLWRMLELEATSTDFYSLGYKNPGFKKSGQEFTQNVIRYF